MSRLLRCLAPCILLFVCLSSRANAESTIRHPGQHLTSVELEPHLTLRPFDTPDNDIGLGVGFRASVPVMDNGFIPDINNSVAVSFGLDWVNYHACRGYTDCGAVNQFTLPVAMQWNFFLSKSWSVFAEPGLSLNFYSSSCDHDVYIVTRNGQAYREGDCHNHRALDLALFLGARWHFGSYTALTMRIGWPYWSVGVSFL